MAARGHWKRRTHHMGSWSKTNNPFMRTIWFYITWLDFRRSLDEHLRSRLGVYFIGVILYLLSADRACNVSSDVCKHWPQWIEKPVFHCTHAHPTWASRLDWQDFIRHMRRCVQKGGQNNNISLEALQKYDFAFI